VHGVLAPTTYPPPTTTHHLPTYHLHLPTTTCSLPTIPTTTYHLHTTHHLPPPTYHLPPPAPPTCTDRREQAQQTSEHAREREQIARVARVATTATWRRALARRQRRRGVLARAISCRGAAAARGALRDVAVGCCAVARHLVIVRRRGSLAARHVRWRVGTLRISAVSTLRRVRHRAYLDAPARTIKLSRVALRIMRSWRRWHQQRQ